METILRSVTLNNSRRFCAPKKVLMFSLCSYCSSSYCPDYFILDNYLFICLLKTLYLWRESQTGLSYLRTTLLTSMVSTDKLHR